MNAPFVSTDVYPAQWLRPTVEFLLASQRSDGEIPWFDGGHTDPWDHTEAAMGLSIAGELGRRSAPTGGWQSNSSTTAVGGPVIEVGIPTRPLIEEKRTTSLTLRPGSGTTSS